MASIELQIIYALLGGLLPALIWLLFWLREDIHPEPKRLIAKAFFAGVLTIPFALFLESILYCAGSYMFLGPWSEASCSASQPIFGMWESYMVPFTVIGFAAIEEYVKYKGARIWVLKGKDFDEPVDAMIYLITASLGFAAFENFFFLIPAFGHSIFEGFVIGNLRFLGATLLHSISSGVVGYALALSFYRPNQRSMYMRFGLLTATLLHAIFNFTIMKGTAGGESQDMSILLLMLTGMVLIFAFDRVKKIKRLTPTS